MSAFNAEEYWRDKPRKTWVVHLERKRGRKVLDTQKIIVSASTEQEAKRTAVANSFIKPTNYGSCRLATPADLGCISSDSCVWCSGRGQTYNYKIFKDVKCDRCRGTGKREAA